MTDAENMQPSLLFLTYMMSIKLGGNVLNYRSNETRKMTPHKMAVTNCIFRAAVLLMVFILAAQQCPIYNNKQIKKITIHTCQTHYQGWQVFHQMVEILELFGQ